MNENNDPGSRDQKPSIVIVTESMKHELDSFIDSVADRILCSPDIARSFHTLVRIARLAIMKAEDIFADGRDLGKEVEYFNAHMGTLKKFTAEAMTKISKNLKYPLSEKTIKFIRHLLDVLQYAGTNQADSYQKIMTMILVEIERAYFDGENVKISDLNTRLGVTITQVVQTFPDEIRDWEKISTIDEED